MRKRALILANQHHEDPRFAALPGAAADAEQLSAVLADSAIGGFEVDVLVDGTARNWQKAVHQFFSTAERDDILLLHLSCHGRKDARNRLHFIARDTEFDMLEATSVSAEFLTDRMEQSRSWRTVLLLDCCYSGAFTKGMRSRGAPDVDVDEAFQGNGRIVITSSTALQYSYEAEALSRRKDQPSVFTSAIVEGLRSGDADFDADGYVTADDLYQFLSRRVPEQVPDQTPTMSVISVDGQIRLARSTKPAATWALPEGDEAARLQLSMIPTRPPRIPGVQVAYRYVPSTHPAAMGGDWFDAFQLPGSRVALVVGDVMGGSGVSTAAAMGRLRAGVLALGGMDLPTGQLLRHLDNMVQKLSDEHLATCLYAVYDPINRTCELASAGHVPPVLVHPDGTGELLEIPAGAPIGVGGVPFVAKKIDVVDGSMLVMCTDGLVEMRDSGMAAGLAALRENLIDPKQTPEDACNTILERLHTEDRKDDVALLVARFDGVAETEVATWKLAVDRSEVRRARQLVRDQLAAWQLDALSDITELLVSELVTNAVRVARDYVQLQLIRVDKLAVEVSDDNHNLPSLEPAESLDEHGRGLIVLSKLAERWGTARKAVGKVVWFELPLPGTD
ncbi:hypothetical protein C7C46_23660 [Streptomyces tateyamensis]|uniref:protein-serine/threonine phosphatase n=1 Tax=Streptomyces tateyamensis TaxID=565073 RepID=A0A2V4N121_9ACTN|nr:SpoIIE family protein phosphatase [Streptomyces tateyamensis]PYC75792.1 hypothetical protein C7C46_23660 [Streptomyces tateyamensis]